MVNKEYIALKNLIHNELGISKEDIKSLVEQAVKSEVESFIKRYFQQNEKNLNDLAERTVKSFLDKAKFEYSYSTFQNNFIKEVSKVISKKIELKIKE